MSSVTSQFLSPVSTFSTKNAWDHDLPLARAHKFNVESRCYASSTNEVFGAIDIVLTVGLGQKEGRETFDSISSLHSIVNNMRENIWSITASPI